MRALIIGGNGFIGSHLKDTLLAGGHFVRVLDTNEERFRPRLENIESLIGAMSDKILLKKALKDIDVVYHLAGNIVPSSSNNDTTDEMCESLSATLSLLNTMRPLNVTRIVFMSSGGTIYGKSMQSPITEDHVTNPISCYGILKLTTEKYLLMYKERHGIDPVILRAANAYGPRQGKHGIQGVVGTYLHSILKNLPLKVFGDGNVVRDFIYVTDMAELCVQAGLSDKGGIYNLSSGTGLSVNQVIQTLQEITGYKPDVIHQETRDFDVPEIILSNAQAKKTLNWAPKVTFPEGVRSTWEWVKSEHKKAA